MRIGLVGSAERARYLEERASPGVSVTAYPPAGGPETIESMVDEYAYIPGMLDAVRAGERDGCDAMVVGCFGDPGVDAARELVRIPVLGPGETSMLVAAMLGQRFAVVTVLDSVVRPLQRLAQAVGVGGKLASVRVLGVPVMEVRTDHERVLALAQAACRRVVEEDDADVVVLGCGSLSFYAAELAAEVGVPVLNPLLTALRAAEMLVGAGLTHSKRAYPVPPKLAGQALRG